MRWAGGWRGARPTARSCTRRAATRRTAARTSSRPRSTPRAGCSASTGSTSSSSTATTSPDPVSEWADALLAQVEAGAIGGFGVSNWTVERLRALRAHLDAAGADHLRAFSNHFSLARMLSPPWPGCLALSTDDLREIGDLGVSVLAWSSLATGFFAGRDTPHWDDPANRARRNRAAQLAERLGTTAPAVALAYVLHQPGRVRPVVGTRSTAHLDVALGAAAIRLGPDDLVWLENGEGG